MITGMEKGKQFIRGLLRWSLIGFGVSWLGAATGIGCIYGNCIAGPLVALSPEMFPALAVIAGPSAAVFAFVWAVISTGRAWVFKWIAVFIVIAGLVPWATTNAYMAWTLRQVEAREVLKSLPAMAERTPLVLYAGKYRGRLTFHCTYAMSLFHKTQGPGGILAVRLPDIKEVDFTKPVSIADLPLELHTLNAAAVDLAPAAGSADSPWVVTDDEGIEVPGQALKDRADLSELEGEVFEVRTLTATERSAAAAEVDYLILSPCDKFAPLDAGLDLNPALEGLPFAAEVSLALAPLEKGDGTIDMRSVSFDLLDVDWSYMAEGLVPFLSNPIWSRNTTVGLEALIESFCAASGGTRNPAC